MMSEPEKNTEKTPDSEEHPENEDREFATNPPPGHRPPPEEDTPREPVAPAEAAPEDAPGDTPPPSEEAPSREQALETELDKAKDQMLRALAEAENARKRAQKEREDARLYSITDFARDLLEVADNLRRALEAIPEDLMETEPRVKNLVDGIKATERGLHNIFEKNHIQTVHPLDENFDPNFHEVMMEMPGTGKPPGTVVLVMEPGYILHERLLRPARVGVAKDEGQGGGEPSGPASPGGQIDQEV